MRSHTVMKHDTPRSHMTTMVILASPYYHSLVSLFSLGWAFAQQSTHSKILDTYSSWYETGFIAHCLLHGLVSKAQVFHHMDQTWGPQVFLIKTQESRLHGMSLQVHNLLYHELRSKAQTHILHGSNLKFIAFFYESPRPHVYTKWAIGSKLYFKNHLGT